MITASFSGMKLYRKCHRRYQYEKVLKRVPLRKAFAFRFGLVVHAGLQAFDEGGDVLSVLRKSAVDHELEPIDLATAEMLVAGYMARWPDKHELVGCEVRWELPLVNPRTGRASRTFMLKGFIDKLMRIDGKLKVLERKTSGENIQPGSMYWDRVNHDEQVSLYWRACVDMDITGVLYDVIGKPSIRPHKATPREQWRYTKGKPCKPCNGNGYSGVLSSECDECRGSGYKDPPRLYSNCRTEDESPIEWAKRLSEHVIANPDKYYQRHEVVRFPNELKRTEGDIWDLTQLMRRSYIEDLWPRNPNACHMFNSRCPYIDVCYGPIDIDDETRFINRDHQAKEASRDGKRQRQEIPAPENEDGG